MAAMQIRQRSKLVLDSIQMDAALNRDMGCRHCLVMLRIHMADAVQKLTVCPCVVESCVAAWKLWTTCLLMQNGMCDVVATPETSDTNANKVSNC